MNKHIMTLGVVALLAGSLLTIYHSVRKQPSTPASKPSSISPKIGAEQKESILSPNDEISVRILQQSADLNQLMAYNGRAMTPRIIQFTVDRLMESRDSRYQALFGELGLTSQTVDQVLQHIRDSEVEKNYAIKQFRLEGEDGRKQMIQTLEVIRTNTERNLRFLLGVDKTAEITNLRDQMDSELAEKGLKIVEEQMRPGG